MKFRERKASRSEWNKLKKRNKQFLDEKGWEDEGIYDRSHNDSSQFPAKFCYRKATKFTKRPNRYHNRCFLKKKRTVWIIIEILKLIVSCTLRLCVVISSRIIDNWNFAVSKISIITIEIYARFVMLFLKAIFSAAAKSFYR